MGNDRKVILFGDEIGLPQMIKALPKGTDFMCVVDLKRNPNIVSDLSLFEAKVIGCRCREDMRDLALSLRKYGPELGCISSFSYILPSALLDLFPRGVVNLHGGRLPYYRGANVLQWAIINGEKQAGVTLHYVDEGVDTGPIIDMALVEISMADTAIEVRENLMNAGLGLWQKWIGKMLVSKVPACPQDEKCAKVWKRRKPEDSEIDWTWDDLKISNLTRAMVAPWPRPYYRDRNGNICVVDKVMSADEVKSLRNGVTQ